MQSQCGIRFITEATSFRMPIAWAVAKTWGDYTSIPMDLNVSFFWWIPDPTFLRRESSNNGTACELEVFAF